MSAIKEPATIVPQEKNTSNVPKLTRKIGLTQHKPGCATVKNCKC